MREDIDKYSVFSTEMGWMGLVSTKRGIYASVLPQKSKPEAEKLLLEKVPFKPQLNDEHFSSLQRDLQNYFQGQKSGIQFLIDWSWATPFQKKVLEAVSAIPAGTCITYGEAAVLAGSPRGARAVGRALATNMIPVLIPCHRVIKGNGKLGGFTGAGPDMKSRLLLLEGFSSVKLNFKWNRKNKKT